MKVWGKPGLETLNVSMTMNNNGLNSVIVSSNDDKTDPVETTIDDGTIANSAGTPEGNGSSSGSDNITEGTGGSSGSNGTSEGTGGSSGSNGTSEGTGDSSGSIDTSEGSDDLATDKDNVNPEQSTSTEEENCSTTITDETVTDSDNVSIFEHEGELFSESSTSEEIRLEGSCTGDLILDEELEKVLAAFDS